MRLIDCEYDSNSKLVSVTVEDGGEVCEMERVKRGQWRKLGEYCHHSKEFMCSVCSGIIEYTYYTRNCSYDYCPNCGTKMDLEEVIK